jgi:short-subunit dehydrogenase involved in D-alanine esterification of teichoic acids
MAVKIWFITGTSRGFGREWAIAALERGDKVAATARDISSLDDLAAKYDDAVLPMELDVTDRGADVAAVKRAHDYFGRLDVVVNNAGYGQFGMVEEISEQEIRAQLETNLLGALWITQAALPYLREQGSGHILQVSSIGGISAFMNTGAYHASKWGKPVTLAGHSVTAACQAILYACRIPNMGHNRPESGLRAYKIEGGSLNGGWTGNLDLAFHAALLASPMTFSDCGHRLQHATRNKT